MTMCVRSEEQFDRLQDRLQYRFTDPACLAQALVHRSWLNEATGAGMQSNERLEFLGDSILGSVVARRLFLDFPDADEGWMTVARSSLVRKETLAAIARVLEIGPCLLMGAGIANDGARDRDTVLSRALEAILGAVWIDGGSDAAEQVILRLLSEELTAIADAGVTRDAKSQLQLVTQARSGAQPVYAILDERGPQHDPSFQAVVQVDGAELAQGEGRSKQAAEMDAARRALRLLLEESA